MEKIAKLFNHDFNSGDFFLFNKNGDMIYLELSDGYQEKIEYNKNRKRIYYENSDGVIVDHRKTIIIDGKTYRLVEE